MKPSFHMEQVETIPLSQKTNVLTASGDCPVLAD